MQFKITFEDHGQDFLTWTIDTELEQVVACEPFQASLWVGRKCTQRAFEVGGHVWLYNTTREAYPDAPDVKIKYPIAQIEIITA
jgi:hypothetical protein